MEGDKPAFLFKGFVNILIELLVIEGVESGILKNILSAHVFVISLVDIYVMRIMTAFLEVKKIW